MPRNQENYVRRYIGTTAFRGVDSKTDPQALPLGKSADGQNLICNSQYGTVLTRPGYTPQYNTLVATVCFILTGGADQGYVTDTVALPIATNSTSGIPTYSSLVNIPETH